MEACSDPGSAPGGQDRPVTLAAGMFLGQFAAAFPLRLLPLMLPAFAHASTVDPAMIGYFASTASAGALTGSLFAARLEARLTPPGALAAVMALSAVAAVTMVHASTATFFLGSFLAGLADGPTPAIGSVALQSAAPTRMRGTLFSAKMLGGGVGGMSAGLLFPLAAMAGTWIAPVALAAVVPLVCILFVGATWRAWPVHAPATDEATDGPRIRSMPFAAVLRLPHARRLAWTGGLMAVSQGAWYGFFPSFLIADLGRSVVLAGALMATAAAGIVVSRIVLGALADAFRSGSRLYAAVCAGSCLPWTALALTTPDVPDGALFAIAVLFGTTVGSWVGLQHAELARATPREDFAGAATVVTFVMFAGLTASGVIVTLAAAAAGGLAPCFLGLAVVGLAVGAYQLVNPLRSGAVQERI